MGESQAWWKTVGSPGWGSVSQVGGRMAEGAKALEQASRRAGGQGARELKLVLCRGVSNLLQSRQEPWQPESSVWVLSLQPWEALRRVEGRE